MYLFSGYNGYTACRIVGNVELEAATMFSRIRYAAHVLSYSPPKVSRFDEPDVTFEEECRPEVTKTSARIGTAIEFLLIYAGVGLLVGPVMYRLFSGKETTSLLTLTGIAAAAASGLITRLVDDLNTRLRLQLRIGEKIAPYFGHKITKAVQTLRG